ncbi:MAG: hypothetical protein DHS20C18_36810 [Saprospiraceae bacterium]|nr:MAG: hypothetical protein DHS20C18_36810 [Saprospiraceae bacterium]
MKQFLFLSIIYALSLNFNPVYTQGVMDTLSIYVKTRSIDNHIKVRWAPDHYRLWKAGIRHGYTLERRTMQRNGKLLTTKEQSSSLIILQKGVKPQPPEYWKAKIDSSDLVGIAAGTMYGENLEIADIAKGDYLQIYHANQQQDAQFGFGLFAADQSYSIALDMGLAFTDTEVAPGENYLYRVYLDHDISGIIVQTGVATGSIDHQEALPALYPIIAEFGDKQVQLMWNQEDFQTFYTSYEVERSDDFGLHFHSASDLPLVPTTSPGMNSQNMFFRDHLPENFKPYIYRVRGKSIFDEYGPYSNTVQGKGIPDPLFIQMGITGINEMESGSLMVSWEFPDSLNYRLEGFDLFRANKKDGPFAKVNTTIIPNEYRAFKDTSAKGTNYYKVKAIDIYGHSYYTFAVLGQLSDAIPPAPPTGLKAEINLNGEVQLNWAPNSEDDVMGYRVFMSNSIDGNYAQLTSFYTLDTFYTFQANMNILNEIFFCKIIALDYRENYSDFSQPIEITRPDVIPPIAPLFKKIKPTPKGVFLQWVTSPSEDIQNHLLQRKAAFESNWTTLLYIEKEASITSFLDSTGRKKFNYQYRILAIDEAGLKSSSKIFKSKPIDTGERSPIQAFDVAIDRRNKLIILSWIYPSVSNLYEFVLYRSKGDDAPLRTYKQLTLTSQEISKELLLTGTHFNFIDHELSMDTNYTYQLIAKHKDGGYSPLSELVRVQY